MDTTSYLLKTSFPLLWLLIAVIGAWIRTRHSPSRQAALETWQRWWAVSVVGCGSLWLVISFLALPDMMAETIGFNRTPFEFEIAFANLALAIMGFRAVKATPRERITIGLAAGMFLWGAAIGHVYQWFANGDHAPGNTGGILIYDILMPAVMIILARRAQQLSTTTQPTTPTRFQVDARPAGNAN
ncbi:DUF6790 family protein [Kibdelosporangium lantanae]|uniref:DUF6790 family protein n=2 Tax=Kibdelosporangium lantanae TaxID=1497396 RepID=A0ABW3M9L2_9PSEU